jgi:hypothetical protein
MPPSGRGDSPERLPSERDLRHSVNAQAACRASAELASLPEDLMDLSTKLKIAAVMAAVLMALAWNVPAPSEVAFGALRPHNGGDTERPALLISGS